MRCSRQPTHMSQTHMLHAPESSAYAHAWDRSMSSFIMNHQWKFLDVRRHPLGIFFESFWNHAVIPIRNLHWTFDCFVWLLGWYEPSPILASMTWPESRLHHGIRLPILNLDPQQQPIPSLPRCLRQDLPLMCDCLWISWPRLRLLSK